MSDIERLIQSLAKLPGLGPRSARRAVLHMLARRETVMEPLLEALAAATESIGRCRICGNLDSCNPCTVCADPTRDDSVICVVETVADLWAIQRSGVFRGRFHVLGGTLSAIDGFGPDDLCLPALFSRASQSGVREIVLALSFTVDGQTTAHYIRSGLADTDVVISGIAHGVPLGGELDYLDDATLAAAFKARRDLE